MGRRQWGGGAKLSGTIGADYSNASSICDLSGPFTDASLGGGDGIAGNVHMFQGSSAHSLVTGAGGAASAGFTMTHVNADSMQPLEEFIH
jgi:hypothetical protein